MMPQTNINYPRWTIPSIFCAKANPTNGNMPHDNDNLATDNTKHQ